MGKTILLVEDNKETLAMVNMALEDAGYATVCHDLLATAANYLRNNKPNLIILDIDLPDGNGLELAARIRRRAETASIPVIALTGHNEMSYKKRAFTTGVDQYLTKPIDLEELLLWVKALFRRINMDTQSAAGTPPLKAGSLEIDKNAYLARYKGVAISDLTGREFELLCCLVEQSPKVLTREDIISKVWKTAAGESLVDTHIHNLRRKLPESVSVKIQSVPGKGFRYFEV